MIKTGLRKINLSYSRISMEDITARLGLDRWATHRVLDQQLLASLRYTSFWLAGNGEWGASGQRCVLQPFSRLADNLCSVDNAEYIVAKAIHDGVIDAVIDRKQRFLFSKVGVALLIAGLHERCATGRRGLSSELREGREDAVTHKLPPGKH